MGSGSTILILSMALFVAAAPAKGAYSENFTTIQADQILDNISKGQNIKYDRVRVIGNFDVQKLDLNLSQISIKELENLFGLNKTKDDKDVPKFINSSIEITNSIFDSDVYLENMVFDKGINFNGDVFSKEAHFNRSIALEPLNFFNATFIGNVSFEEAFIGNSYNEGFKKAIFSQFANFKNAVFLSNVFFIEAIFSKDVDFGGAVFLEDGEFSGAHFLEDAYFEKTEFREDADFTASRFNYPYFINAVFNHTADFWGARFYNAFFNGATFGKEADFKHAEFNEHTSFSDAIFEENAYFGEAVFKGKVDFSGAIFKQDVGFWDAEFNGFAPNFYDTYFNGTAYFTGCKFSMGAIFSEKTHFNKLYIRWKDVANSLAQNRNLSKYMEFLNNYKQIYWYEDADNCYYDYRKTLRNTIPMGLFSSIINLLQEKTYGYGVRPFYPLEWSFGIVVLFGIFWRKKRLGRSKNGSETYTMTSDSLHKSLLSFAWWKNQFLQLAIALSFSFALFLSGTRFFVDPPHLSSSSSIWINVMYTMERILGAIFSFLFLATFGASVIKVTI